MFKVLLATGIMVGMAHLFHWFDPQTSVDHLLLVFILLCVLSASAKAD